MFYFTLMSFDLKKNVVTHYLYVFHYLMTKSQQSIDRIYMILINFKNLPAKCQKYESTAHIMPSVARKTCLVSLLGKFRQVKQLLEKGFLIFLVFSYEYVHN